VTVELVESPAPPPPPRLPRPSLSPSRAGDFLSCPLLFRFRTVDRLPEPGSRDAARGTLVHLVLERLFDRPAAERTAPVAEAMVAPAWAELTDGHPDLLELFAGEDEREVQRWLGTARAAVRRWFTLEDPTRLEPAEREVFVEAELESGLTMRGIVDRIDVAPDGAVRIVDYKSGRAPGVGFEAKALFQLKFYAAVVRRTRGTVPAMLQLVYLGSGEVLRHVPDEDDLRATERKVDAVWRAIEVARETGDWRARRNPLCSWCPHQAICPAWGGTPPPLPDAPPGRTDRNDRTGGSGQTSS
jgi:putative RecB family exonuclease